jgi:ketosteroid isomerase-like protein
MSKEAQNVAILKQAYTNWSESKGGNVDEWMSIMANDIRFGSIAEGGHGAPYLTKYESRDALGAYFGGLLRDWEMIEYTAREFVAQGDRVVMLGHCRWRYKQTGKVVSTPKVDAWLFAGGKAVEFYEYYDTAQLRDATA